MGLKRNHPRKDATAGSRAGCLGGTIDLLNMPTGKRVVTGRHQKQAGYMTQYLNLWTATRTPAQALVRVLSAAVAPKGWPKLLRRMKCVKSVKTSAALEGLVEGKLDMEREGLGVRELAHPTRQWAFPLPVDRREALAAFQALGRTPEFFRRYLAVTWHIASEGAAAALPPRSRSPY